VSSQAKKHTLAYVEDVFVTLVVCVCFMVEFLAPSLTSRYFRVCLVIEGLCVDINLVDNKN
jgi:hypothetical protein